MKDQSSYQSLVFDLDDTLIHCNKYFQMVIDQFAHQMERWFSPYSISREQILQKQYELDIESIHLYGLTTKHFPQSFVNAYEYFGNLVNRPKNDSEISWLLQLGQSVYGQNLEAYPHMHETLQSLKSHGHELYLFTGGDADVQLKKVEQMQLDSYFGDRIFVALHKNTDALEQIIKSNHFDRKATWMIGNSLRTDIIPALETGIHAIHIPAISEWQYNVTDISVRPKGVFYRLNALHEVPPTISNFIGNKS